MVLESLRKVLEPLVVASNLTWLIFRSAFDMITEPEQIEACVQNPQDFLAYMLKKVRELFSWLAAIVLFWPWFLGMRAQP